MIHIMITVIANHATCYSDFKFNYPALVLSRGTGAWCVMACMAISARGSN